MKCVSTQYTDGDLALANAEQSGALPSVQCVLVLVAMLVSSVVLLQRSCSDQVVTPGNDTLCMRVLMLKYHPQRPFDNFW